MDEIIIEGEENSNVVYSGVEIDEPDYLGVDTDTDTDNNEPPVVDSNCIIADIGPSAFNSHINFAGIHICIPRTAFYCINFLSAFSTICCNYLRTCPLPDIS